jgi:hypothetical protein
MNKIILIIAATIFASRTASWTDTPGAIGGRGCEAAKPMTFGACAEAYLATHEAAIARAKAARSVGSMAS